MSTLSSIKTFLYNHGLALCMFGLFAIFLAGLSFTGFLQQNEELQSHNQQAETYLAYLHSGEFIEAIFENWESEFLQMAALVLATIFLRQRGSADSKRIRGKDEVDTSSRYSIIHATSWRTRKKALAEMFYANSLGLALLALFILSFALHATGGVAARNNQAQLHGEESISVATYLKTSQFWYESFQNWQSEFLAVGTLLVLSVYLRQRGSPESKPIGASNKETGS